ncbi:MAG: NAD(P)-binding domain-containing protein, partial [Bacteroidia bacterium]|nr:NAD(P)-binding domain-containing protein [Bacteroidia bacterium]
MNHIAIIGCGNMGLIYANSFLKYKITSTDHLLLVEKNEERRNVLSELHIGKVVTIDDAQIPACNIVILAVKPQDFRALAPELKRAIHKDSVVLSIMAGTEIAFLASELEHKH